MTEIRRAVAQDADAIASLFYDTVRRVNRRDYSPEQIRAWAGPAPDAERWRAGLERKSTFVACRGDELVGFADIEADGHLDMLYVHHAYQGEGIASLLLRRIEREAMHLGIRRMYTEASITARPFFEHRGFVVLEAQDVEREGVIFRNYKMEMNLPADAIVKARRP